MILNLNPTFIRKGEQKQMQDKYAKQMDKLRRDAEAQQQAEKLKTEADKSKMQEEIEKLRKHYEGKIEKLVDKQKQESSKRMPRHTIVTVGCELII